MCVFREGSNSTAPSANADSCSFCCWLAGLLFTPGDDGADIARQLTELLQGGVDVLPCAAAGLAEFLCCKACRREAADGLRGRGSLLTAHKKGSQACFSGPEHSVDHFPLPELAPAW